MEAGERLRDQGRRVRRAVLRAHGEAVAGGPPHGAVGVGAELDAGEGDVGGERVGAGAAVLDEVHQDVQGGLLLRQRRLVPEHLADLPTGVRDFSPIKRAIDGPCDDPLNHRIGL